MSNSDHMIPNNDAVVDSRVRKNQKHSRLGGPIHAERQMRVICVGAGASGLCFAYKLQRSFNNFSLAVYEKNAEVSGTWYENKYPGYVNQSFHNDCPRNFSLTILQLRVRCSQPQLCLLFRAKVGLDRSVRKSGRDLQVFQ